MPGGAGHGGSSQSSENEAGKASMSTESEIINFGISVAIQPPSPAAPRETCPENTSQEKGWVKRKARGVK